MGSNYSRGYSTFGGAEGTPSDKSTLDCKVTVPQSKGENTTIHPNKMGDGDSAGVESGLSMKEGFDAQTEVGPTYNYSQDPMTGNYPERVNPYDQDKTVSSKGKTFMIDR